MTDVDLSTAMDGAVDDELAREWLDAVHRWLREQHDTRLVDGLRAPGAGSNHYSVRVAVSDHEPIRLLLNAAVRLVAAAGPGRPMSNGPFAFTDLPGRSGFELSGFAVARVGDLRRDIVPRDLAGLRTDQVRDVEYHQPTSIGDLCFNRFD